MSQNRNKNDNILKNDGVISYYPGANLTKKILLNNLLITNYQENLNIIYNNLKSEMINEKNEIHFV
jgi:ABC-type iron transport system FetAB permease component